MSSKSIWIITAEYTSVGNIIDICSFIRQEHLIEHCVCWWRLKTLLLLFFSPWNSAHIISSHRWRCHLEKEAQRYYSGSRHEITVSVQLLVSSTLHQKEGAVIIGSHNLMKSIIHFVILYHISSWQPIKWFDKLHPCEGINVFFTSNPSMYKYW